MKIPNKPFLRIWNYFRDCFKHGSFWAKRWKEIAFLDMEPADYIRTDRYWLGVKSYPWLQSKEQDPNWRVRDDNWVVFEMNSQALSYLVIYKEEFLAETGRITVKELGIQLFAMRVSNESFQITTRNYSDVGALNRNSNLLKPSCVFGQDRPLSSVEVIEYAQAMNSEVVFI